MRIKVRRFRNQEFAFVQAVWMSGKGYQVVSLPEIMWSKKYDQDEY